jgi:glycerophosphoryl diester phosphodiesterase
MMRQSLSLSSSVFRMVCTSMTGVVLAAVCVTACSTIPPNPTLTRQTLRPAALPMVVAHRGGAADAPENTLVAIEQAVRNGADAMWLSVQRSLDDVPVLYRPGDLSALTEGNGPVSAHRASALARLNAGVKFHDAAGRCPYCDSPVPIPTLRQALQALPRDMPVILDMKALPAEPQARAVAQVLTEESAWDRVLIYSTDAAYQSAFAAYPQARVFESRDATRDRLVGVLLAQRCDNPPVAPLWTAFELERELTVTEKFTLGEATSNAKATMWTPATIACTRQKASVHVLMIAVNDEKRYRTATCLRADAVLSDSVVAMMKTKDTMAKETLVCTDE